jgi:murein L,D-transpeptidase YcbB/YkuD
MAAPRFDVSLSAAMLRYLRHLHHGRVDSRSIGFRLNAQPEADDYSRLLRAAVAENRLAAVVRDLRPPLAQYRLLRERLSRYRALAADPSFFAVLPIGTAVHPGDPYGDAEVLRRELVAFGDMRATSAVALDRYEGPLVAGVKQFQVRHGLDADGVLGKKTVEALQVPPARRVRQIELALERLRWLPDLGHERVIALNIPMFRLWVWDALAPDAIPRFGMDAIVGRALNTQTPVFVEEMREVIFRPYWNVPAAILRHEVVPAIVHDPGYLQREDMEIVSGAGSAARVVASTPETLAALRSGTLHVRQRPGPKNALGLVKFVFPNDADVYMHGTPAQSLFAQSRRDFSHGCVRVADPIALAEWVLRDQPEWTRDRIVAATNGSATITVKLMKPIAVILFYTTAAVMEDGSIRFADDIYHHDDKLDRALRARPASD